MIEIIYSLELDQLLAASKDDLFADLREAGFDGIEAPVHPHFTGVRGTSDFAGIMAKLAKYNLSAPALSLFWTPYMTRSESEIFHGMIGSLGNLGSVLHSSTAIIRIPRQASVPAGISPSHEELRREMTGLLITAQNHTEPVELSLAVELHNEGLLGSYSDAMDWLYLHAPGVGIALDTLSLAETGGDAYYSSTELGATTRMVYISEPLSSDRFNYAELLAGLKASNYTGPLAVRAPSWETQPLRETVSDLRRLWIETTAKAVAVTES